jgi:hypothetical protein
MPRKVSAAVRVMSVVRMPSKTTSRRAPFIAGRDQPDLE